jgi:hypothetical protein
MKKRVGSKQSVQTNAKKTSTPPSREYIQALRGKFRGKGLMKALMAEKERERSAVKRVTS